MDSASAGRFREVLLDRDQFELLARDFMERSTEVHATEVGDEEFGEYLHAGLDLLMRENLEIVFAASESPIETVFVNSLILAFIKADPLNLVVQPPVPDALTFMDDFRIHSAEFRKFAAWYKSTHSDSLSGFDDFIDGLHTKGKIDDEEHWGLRRHLAFYEYFGLENRFHLFLQAGIPDIVEKGRSIRPDLLLWIPSDSSIKVIVECDGFEYHSEKASFDRDRVRDRALTAAGFQVLRYSGTEIHSDPIGTAADLADHLWALQPDADD
jgi:hypothetical protein